MIVTGHQPAYLPWLGLFHKIALSDIYVLLDEVQFEKNSFINRNKIKTPNGPQLLTVPLSKSGYRDKPVKDLEINNTDNWGKNHLERISQNYKKAPFFDGYADFFESVYNQKWTNLIDLVIYMLEFFLKELKINTRVIKQSELHTLGKKQDLVLEMCKKLNADIFVFGALGRDYADENVFRNNGIKIYFQDYIHPSYPQQWGEFVPYMSIIDLLFNVGPEKASTLIMENNIQRKDLETIK